MQDTELYRHLLGLETPWTVTEVALDMEHQQIDVHVAHPEGTKFCCSECGKELSCYDHAPERTWRHLDSCQFKTILHAAVPRVQCPEHGVKQVNVPWAERGSRFTLLFERFAIDVLLSTQTVKGAMKILGTRWDQTWNIVCRSVARDQSSVEAISDGRDTESGVNCFSQLSEDQIASVQAVAMDMSAAYVKAAKQALPLAEEKIVHDRFHVMQLATKAVDKVRRGEHRQLKQDDDNRLAKTKYLWIKSQENLTDKQRTLLEDVFTLQLETGKAWSYKELLRDLWHHADAESAAAYFRTWYRRVIHTKLSPLKKVARTIKERLANVVSYCTHGITNAVAEGMNSKIMSIKRRVGGYRNRDHFKTAIYFYCGGLDLHPR